MFRHITRGRLGGLAAVSAVLALVLVAAAGAARTGAAVPYVYADQAGDSTSAPDIQKVVLTDNGNGLIGVEIDLAAVIPDDGSMVVFGIDADRNAQTGDSSGFEFAVIAGATGAGLLRWDGANWQPFNHQPASLSLVGGALSFSLSMSDFGVPSFNFVVLSFHGDDMDAAPEYGAFSYPDPAARPAIAGIVVSAAALFPTAGKTFTVAAPQVKLTTGDIVAPDSVTLTLTYKGQALKPVRQWAWKIPKTYKGKHLTQNVAVTYQGSTRTISLPVVPK